ncbi:MAG TPA: hypothetical protein PKL77_07975 [Candidatus Omnitrophota bacterium]|nr:hypothetical protein [Candidatus Omnitrophota bacterium]HPT06950.1 hypothetical protein [Candidatus Omnitrophota bacterium]
MKRMLIGMVTVAALISLYAVSFAETAKQPVAQKQTLEVTCGTVVSVDTAKNEVVVKDSKAGAEKTFAVTSKVATSLKAGEEVKVKSKAGSMKAESVKVIKKTECKKK